MLKIIFSFLFSAFILFNSGCSNSSSPIITTDIETDTPSNQGIDEELLESAHLAAEMLGHVNAILVARNGKLVSEKYFRGTDKNNHHNVRSVSKSFTSALTGIAIEQGYISGVDEKVMDYFPEFENAINDNRFMNMTIENLLNMESGLDTDRSIYVEVFYSNDWLHEIFTELLEFSPGSSVQYSTASTHLLSVILARATGKTLKEFAEANLFTHLGITADYWNRDPQGNYFSGSDLEFQPREMLKFGLLYQYEGNLYGSQIIPKQWVADTFTKGYNGSRTWGAIDNMGYGYLWWRGEINNYEIFTALGHGGQFIMLVPALDLLIVTSSYSEVDWDEANLQEQQITQIIADYILPAVN